MLKRIIALTLAATLTVFCFAGCGKKKTKKKTASSEVVSSEPVIDPKTFNPLTGVSGFDKNLYDQRPVAIMVNNTYIAQAVQCGVKNADIVYETEVEGRETRLMAVFKDISKAGKIGSVRSARFPFVELALGHDAVYLHHGQDPTYCAPHLKDIDHITVDTNNCGKRIPNGLAWEHTLFAFGDSAWETITKTVKRTTTDKPQTFATFAKEETPVSFAGNVANVVNTAVQYGQTFTYDPENGLYYRSAKGKVSVDYETKEKIQVKNVFVLLTTIANYPDGTHRQVYLDGGEGYYAVNGTYTPIRWTKGAGSASFTFTDQNGAPLNVNPGSSWVCINNTDCVPSFQ